MIIYQVDDMLEEYYWEHIAPLEKQIKELGGKVPKNQMLNPFASGQTDIMSFGLSKNGINFNLLYDELLSSGFLISQKK